MILALYPYFAHQVRPSLSGVIGFDIPACAEIASNLGASHAWALFFLPFIERGFIAGVNEREPAEAAR